MTSATSNILQLPAATGVTPADELWVVQGGTDKRMTAAILASLFASEDFITVLPTNVDSSGDYDVLTTDQYVYLQGAFTRNVNLPSLVDMLYRMLWIKVDSNGLTNPQTILPDGSETIDDMSSVVLNGPRQWVLLYAESLTNWQLLN
jgi:hypothetical protein